MAADDEKTSVEVGESSAPEQETSKGPSKLVLFGGIGAAVVVLGVVLALFVLKPMMTSSSSAGNTEQTGTSEGHVKHKPKPKKTKNHGDGQSMLYAIKDIVVNPAGTGGTRFLSVSFGFELGSPELAHEFEKREALVRDALITILSAKTVAQLTDAKQKEIVRYQVKKRLSQLLDTEEIAGVYYTDFVLQ